jgi:hypothetical protein
MISIKAFSNTVLVLPKTTPISNHNKKKATKKQQQKKFRLNKKSLQSKYYN